MLLEYMRDDPALYRAARSNARIAQLVVRDLAKVEVAGSSPVSRSKLWGGLEKVPAWSHKPN